MPLLPWFLIGSSFFSVYNVHSKKKKKVKSVRFSRMNRAKLGIQQPNIVMSFSTSTIFLKVIDPIQAFHMNGTKKDSFIYKIRIKGEKVLNRRVLNMS